MKINKFSGVKDSAVRETVTIGDFLEDIITGEYAEEISEIRKLEKMRNSKETPNNAKEALKMSLDALKAKLPAVTLSGTFNGKRSKKTFAKHSGVMQIDIDNCFDSLEDIRASLISDPHILFVFTSPRGNGLKAGLRVDDGLESNNDVHRQAKEYFGFDGSDMWDDSVKDVSRLCFYSHDEECYINEDADVFRVLSTNKNPKKVAVEPLVDGKAHASWANDLIKTARKMIADHGDGERHAGRLKAGYLLGGGVAHGLFTAEYAEESLIEVVRDHTRLDIDIAMVDIRDSIKAGSEEPLEVPRSITESEEIKKSLKSAIAIAEGKIAPPKDDNVFYKTLGYHNGEYFFQPVSTGDIVSMSTATQQNIIKLAPYSHWVSVASNEDGTKPDWVKCCCKVVEECSRKHFYPGNVRGRGVWSLDDKSTVVNYGDNIIEDDSYVYKRGLPLKRTTSEPLTKDEASQYMKAINLLPIRSNLERNMLAGWVVSAVVCGGLKWRSHIWVTGQSGSGKSWTNDMLISPFLGQYALKVKGDATTEAGLRQNLAGDALAVVHDEAESDSAIGRRNMDNKILLARASSTDDSSVVVKGTAGGSAMRFAVRSSFCFLSIGIPALNQADESRISVVNLYPRVDKDSFNNLKDIVMGFDADYCDRFIARSIQQLPVINESVEVLREVLVANIKNTRAADQLATLLAGAWSIEHDECIDHFDAEILVNSLDIDGDISPAQVEADHDSCLDDLRNLVVRDINGNDSTISKLVASHDDETLSSLGVKVKDDLVFIKVRSTNLRHALSRVDSRFSATYSNELKRVEGSESKVVNINGTSARCVGIPVSLFKSEYSSLPKREEMF